MTDKELIHKALGEMSPEALRYFFPGYDAGRMRLKFMDVTARPGRKGAESFHINYCKRMDADNAAASDNDASPAMSFETMESACAPACEPAGSMEEEDGISEDIAEKLMAEVERIQRKYGITIKQLEAVLSYKVKLSHLRITRLHDIILDDFDMQEVKMDTLTKTVFFLFLRHPEGIRFKDMSDHAAELEEIYMSITGRTDVASLQRSIRSLTDPLDNSINEKVSKVKKAFLNVVDDRVARFYYISGKQGTAKNIPLDRSLVIWE